MANITVRRTRFAGIGFICQQPGLWRFVDLHDGQASPLRVVGPHYRSREELLADLPRYAAESWGYHGDASVSDLVQRAVDGYPEGADSHLRASYGPIPDCERFQAGSSYGYEKPAAIHGWQWSETFRRWSALVTFHGGWRGYTWPEPQQ